MAKCITERTAQRYLEFLARNGVVIINSEYINTYVDWNSVSGRMKTRLTDKMVKSFYQYSEANPDQPIFMMLNLVVTEKSDKHAMCLCMTKGQRGGVIFELFDPNGLVDGPTYEKYTMGLSKLVAKEYAKRYKVKKVRLIDVRAGRNKHWHKANGNLNYSGDGNCNAIVIYYISLRATRSLKETNDILDNSPMNMERVTGINEYIKERNVF